MTSSRSSTSANAARPSKLVGRRGLRVGALGLALAALSLAGCVGEAQAPKINWVELLERPSAARARGGGRGVVAEAFTGEALGFRSAPTAIELLEAYGYRTAQDLAAAKGLWPRLPLPGGHSIPDPRYPIQTLLGFSYEPSYVIVGAANALILRTTEGSRVVPLDPDRPVGWPEEGTRAQRRERNTFLRSFDRDHELLDELLDERLDERQPAPRVEP